MKEMVKFYLKMDANILEICKMAIFMEKDNLYGQI